MRTVLPNAEKSNKPVLPFGLLESSPKRHDATAAYSPPERFQRRISGFCVGLLDAQEDGLRIAECHAIEFDVIETGLLIRPTGSEPL
jgi:hypothetical protein